METFTCAKCGGVFGKGWTENDAINDWNSRPGNKPFSKDTPLQELAIVCEECFKELMKVKPNVN